MSAPDVTVIVPLHQSADTIVETLDSLLEQGDVRLEVIVVDDRSDDGGPDLARAHPLRPTIVPSACAGLPGTRNTGLARASGRFVVFLDADDLLLPGALPRRLAAARQLPSDTVLATRHLELREGALVPMSLRRQLEADHRLMLLHGNQFAVHAALVPRPLVAGPAPFLEELRGKEDWGLWLRLALSGVRFHFLEVEDCVWRIRPGTLSADTRQRCDDALRVLEHARAWLRACPAGDQPALRRRWRRTRHSWLRHRAWLGLREGDPRAALLDASRAVAAAPGHVATIPLRGLRRLLRAGTRDDGRLRCAVGDE